MKKNKVVWLFAGGPMQEPAAKKILSLGYGLILTDFNKNCNCAKYAIELIELNTFDILGNLRIAEDLRRKYDIVACLTIAADCHETVARVCKFLSLIGIDPKISHICRHKNLTREILTKSNIIQPKFKCVNDIKEAKAFIEEIGGKGVIKATDNSGSRGFSKINSVEEITEEIFKSAVLAGTTGSVLIEELLIPKNDCISELSIETLWFNGNMFWLNWVDRLFRSDKKFFKNIFTTKVNELNWAVEIGHINPAYHPIEVKEKIHKMIFSAGCAIGIDKEIGGHILKADIMLTNSGPVIIELTPRLSGGWDSSCTTPARGGDFQGGVIQLALGKKLDLKLWETYFEIKNPKLYASIYADVPNDAKDCIGRKFSLGCGLEREKSLQLAIKNSKDNIYVI